MIFEYLIAVLIVNILGVVPGFVDAVNSIFNSDLSATTIFWYGLLAAFILGMITD